MAEVLKGAPVAARIKERIIEKIQKEGLHPVLSILRVGERPDDLAYEKSIIKQADLVGVEVRVHAMPLDVSEKDFFDKMQELNEDRSVSGILLFRPLPKHIDAEKARLSIRPEKDIDGCTDLSLAGVFTNSSVGFPPCTAKAAMEILRYYEVPMRGKKAAIIGRSLVIGRPVAMLLMHENATVTICHTKTENVPAVTREADIVIAASGVLESVDRNYLRNGQTVIDVGINWSEEKQKICGDVKAEEIQDLALSYTPVPGGVGSVTTAVLLEHVVEAAYNALLQG